MSAIQETIHQMGRQVRAAAYQLAQLTADEKNAILRAMAAAIRKNAQWHNGAHRHKGRLGEDRFKSVII